MQASLLHDQSQIAETRSLKPEELPFEFMLNALRLREGVPSSLYTDRCGLSTASMTDALNKATRQGLLVSDPTRLAATPQGWRFLNELQSIFL
jgi:oxygen-independent coproporphyrinogen-3 oxidase